MLIPGNQNVYLGKEDAQSWFGDRNFNRLAELMEFSSLSQRQKERTRRTFYSYLRMPYTNNWRMRGTDLSRRDCLECTYPAYSGLNGVKLADQLNDNGYNVIGYTKT